MFACPAAITERIEFVTAILPQRQTVLVARQAADLTPPATMGQGFDAEDKHLGHIERLADALEKRGTDGVSGLRRTSLKEKIS